MLEQAIYMRRRSAPMDRSKPEPLSALGGMVALISHDLRHPLTAILANAEFLSRPDLTKAERNELYREIRSAVDRMNELLSSLLQCSAGRDGLRLSAHSIVDTVERVIRMTSVRQEFRRIVIRHDHEGIAAGWFDAKRLERVLVNLLKNACEAVSPDAGQVVITTKGDRTSLQIGVWDNGEGVPSTIRGAIFEPFVSYGKPEGSGLGLTIAKKIVEDHGGKIYLDGRVRAGTLFRITIPFGMPEEHGIRESNGL
jgi:signal transduction histidine kinase